MGGEMQAAEQPGAKVTTVDLPVSGADERDFWGIHKFQEAQDSLCCSRCGWGFHDPIHKKVNS